jgi:hypothetical protein
LQKIRQRCMPYSLSIASHCKKCKVQQSAGAAP